MSDADAWKSLFFRLCKPMLDWNPDVKTYEQAVAMVAKFEGFERQRLRDEAAQATQKGPTN